MRTNEKVGNMFCDFSLIRWLIREAEDIRHYPKLKRPKTERKRFCKCIRNKLNANNNKGSMLLVCMWEQAG